MKQIKAVTKMILGAAVAGAFLLATPNRAQAQVSFGVAVGNYPPPPPYAYGNGYVYNNGYAYYGNDQAAYWQQQRWAEHEQQERWEAEQRAEHWRHEQWEHNRDAWRDGYSDRYRDNDDHRDR